mmetsp:Transcript_93732/g.201187  ORF Transcript_93732/g.201187 Transcript_93732/m.201187 type:complete len:792 (-) Transcript_93732:46-2421(-)
MVLVQKRKAPAPSLLSAFRTNSSTSVKEDFVAEDEVEENEALGPIEVEEGVRYYGCISEKDKKSGKMFVHCEELEETFQNREPKITKQSKAPPGLTVGTWVNFSLVDEWPGENWGSPLCVEVELAEPPEGAEGVEEVEEEEPPALPLAKKAKLSVAKLGGKTAAGGAYGGAFNRLRPTAAGLPKPPSGPPPARVKTAAGGGAAAPSRWASAVAAFQSQVGVAAKPTPPASAPPKKPLVGAAKAPQAATKTKLVVRAVQKAAATPQVRKAEVAAAGQNGLSKSGAVAAFRQASKAGTQFQSGFKGGGGVTRRVARGREAEEEEPEEREPFERVFLEAAASLSKAERRQLQQRRAEMQISIEDEGETGAADLMPLTSFEDLNSILPDYILAALEEHGLETPMPIQAQALPMVLSGMDLIGIAKTGSGKTMAYLLPAIVHIEAQEPLAKWATTPIALILAPTRELAVQISEEAQKLVPGSKAGNHKSGLGACCLYGGGSSSKGWQVAALQKGCHIVAATPGRLVDLIETGEVSLSRVTYFVLDEADRMLENGFEDQVGTIAAAIRPDRQMLFFSATWPKEVQELAGSFCGSGTLPARVMVGQLEEGGPVSRQDIVQEVVVFDDPTWEERDMKKQELLYAHLHEVLSVEEHKALVFVSRKTLADEMVNRLWKEGISADAMHGGRGQDMRLAVLEEFKRGNTKLVVTTDVMGRGLDIPDISHVVLYDMCEIEDYVHRIGRTARGPYGEGHALTFFEFDAKWPNLAGELAEVLVQSEQEVPEELEALAAAAQQKWKW